MWEILINPADRLVDNKERANSRLLSALLIVLFPVGIFVSTIPYLFGLEISPINDLDFIIVAGSSLLWLITYSFNRAGYFKISVFFAVFIATVIIFAEVILDNDLEDLAYLLLPLLIVNAFFSLKHVVTILIANIIGIILLPFLFPKFTLEEVISSSAAFMSFGGILLILTQIHASNLQKKRDLALEASELRYTLIAEAVNDGLWDWDLQTNEVYYSPRWKEMLGYENDEITSAPEEWIRFIHPDDLAPSIQHLSNFFDNEDLTS